MTELQPPDGQINGGGALILTSTDNVGAKRQRRPSVRLGDIGGDQSYNSHINPPPPPPPPPRRSNKHPWKQQLPPTITKYKSSKTRTLMNLRGPEFHETLDGEDKEGNLDTVAIGGWKVRDSKSRRSSISTTKRVRSNWVSRVDDGGSSSGGRGGEGEELEKFSGGEDVDNEFRDFESDSPPLKENSPIHSLNNLAIENHEREVGRYRRGISRARVSDGEAELEGPSDTDARNWNNNNSNIERNGVKVWLNQLGLGRYSPIFEIHEVDDEVLPILTLEDLKDMGINAVGSRRKMYSSIQKLGKGFS